jgi:hypothetical protein
MAGIGRKITWGLAGIVATRIARGRTRKALHRDNGATRLPHAAKRRGGFGTAVLWAASAGALLGLADTLRDQRREVTDAER